MKSVWISWILLVLISVFIVLHAFVITDMSNDILKYSDEAKNAVYSERWSDADSSMEQVKSRWEKSGLWVEITISGDQLDDIKVSLERAGVFLREHDKASFLSEFSQFELLIGELPSNEGLGLLN